MEAESRLVDKVLHDYGNKYGYVLASSLILDVIDKAIAKLFTPDGWAQIQSKVPTLPKVSDDVAATIYGLKELAAMEDIRRYTNKPLKATQKSMRLSWCVLQADRSVLRRNSGSWSCRGRRMSLWSRCHS